MNETTGISDVGSSKDIFSLGSRWGIDHKIADSSFNKVAIQGAIHSG